MPPIAVAFTGITVVSVAHLSSDSGGNSCNSGKSEGGSGNGKSKSSSTGKGGSKGGDDFGRIWETVKNKAKKFGRRYKARVKSDSKVCRNETLYKYTDKLWVSQDKTRHGGSALTVWKEESNQFRFFGSLDKNMREMKSKHQSLKDATIPKTHVKFCN